MERAAIMTALTTGGFCSIFAVGVDAVTDSLNLWQVMIAGGVSGFLGSLFARMVLSKRQSEGQPDER